MNVSLFVLLIAVISLGNGASIVGHGTDVLGHIVPVKCTTDCETAGPSIGPVIPNPAIRSLYGIGALKPLELPAPPEINSDSTKKTDTPATSVDTPLYHKGNYAGLGHYSASVHHEAIAHLGPVNHGYHGKGDYGLLGPHGIAVHSLTGNPGYIPHGHPWGYFGHHDIHLATDVVPEGEERNGPLYPYGHLVDFHGYPWASHHPALHHIVFDRTVQTPVAVEAAAIANETEKS